MATHEIDYTHSEIEFEEMRELLVRSYLVSRKPFNWRLAVAENWNHASRFLKPKQYFTNRVHLWKNDMGELISFLIRDNSLTYLQIDYKHRYLEVEMLEWAERNWTREKARIDTIVYDWDVERQNNLIRLGYKNQDAIEDVRIYDLSRSYPEVNLPPEFQITSLAEYGDAKARIDLENSIWGVSLDEAWFRGKSSAPSYSTNWDLIAVSSDGKLVAQSLVWLYSNNQTAEIDPLGTHPAYRKLGLAKALVLESFKRMYASGIHYAYIASESQDLTVNHLYTSLQPIETYKGYRWSKKIS